MWKIIIYFVCSNNLNEWKQLNNKFENEISNKVDVPVNASVPVTVSYVLWI